MMKKYQIENPIGSGNFSTVFRAINSETKKPCAIKIMKSHAEIALHQANLLKKFQHPNIISLLDFQQNNQESKLVLEEAGINGLSLYQIFKYGLNEEQVKCILFQAALGLAYVHSFGIIHRDIKPENILINRKTTGIKIIDFGLAISQTKVITDYIATRWYRAPENLLATKEYTCAMDVFSLACVIIELYLGNAIFPGENNIDQISKIFNLLGYPSAITWPQGVKKMRQLGITSNRHLNKFEINLRQILSSCNPSLVDLLQKMLILNPNNRIKCEEIVKNPYFHDIKTIIPNSSYIRFELDYLKKSQLNFKNSKHINAKRSLQIKKQSNKQENRKNQKKTKDKQFSQQISSSLHKSAQHNFLLEKQSQNNDNGEKNMKKFYSQRKNKKISVKKKQTKNKKTTQIRKSSSQYLNTEKSVGKIVKNSQNIKSRDEGIPNQKQKITHSFLPLEVIKSSESIQIENQTIVKNDRQAMIPNIPIVETVTFFENQQIKKRGQQKENKETIENNKTNSFVQYKRFLRIQSMNSLNKTPQVRKQRFRGDPQLKHNFGQKSPWIQQNNMKMDRKKEVNAPEQHLRRINSPTFHHFQRPPPTFVVIPRKNTFTSPQHALNLPQNNYVSFKIGLNSQFNGVNSPLSQRITSPEHKIIGQNNMKQVQVNRSAGLKTYFEHQSPDYRLGLKNIQKSPQVKVNNRTHHIKSNNFEGFRMHGSPVYREKW